MARRSNKVSQHHKKNNIKNRKQATRRRKKAQRRARGRARRPKRNLLGGHHFYTLEAFVRWLYKFLGGLLQKNSRPNPNKPHTPSMAYFLLCCCVVCWALLICPA